MTAATISPSIPRARCPRCELDSGEVLTENAVVLQYLGDRASLREVLPPLGDFRRYRVLEMVNFITTELHKRFSLPVRWRKRPTSSSNFVKASLSKKLDWIDEQLGAGPFLWATTLRFPTLICS